MGLTAGGGSIDFGMEKLGLDRVDIRSKYTLFSTNAELRNE